jgi:hypothetical protein
LGSAVKAAANYGVVALGTIPIIHLTIASTFAIPPSHRMSP